MNAICLSIDRLHAGYLGAYGNSWVGTPGLDQIAAQSFVFDQAFIDSPDLPSLCRSWWLGRHALTPRVPEEMQNHLGRQLASAGVRTILLTDEPLVGHSEFASGFQDVVQLEVRQSQGPADTAADSYLARCFAALIDWLESAREPFFLWCHLQGLQSPWDAPLDRREAYADEDDPPPPQFTAVPSLLLDEDFDPDELLGIIQAYAGQVSLLDTCLDALDEFLSASGLRERTLLALLSARGFPLGEHRRVGPWDNALHNELAHIPLLMQFPDGLGAGFRSQMLVEPADLWATLLDVFQVAPIDSPTARSLLQVVRGEVGLVRDRLLIVGQGEERAIVTPAWHLRKGTDGELFVRPDDWWQASDVSSRCEAVVEGLRAAVDEYEQALQSGQVSQLPPLGETLVCGTE